MLSRNFEYVARVEFHLGGGYTLVMLEEVNYDGSPVRWEIPTEAIPASYRKIGSRFLLKGQRPDGHAELGEIRQILSEWSGRPLDLESPWLFFVVPANNILTR